MFTWHSYWTGIYPTQVSPSLSSHTFAWHGWRCHGWWRRRAWGRRMMIDFLPWGCHGCWMRTNWMKNSLTNQEPRSERSSLCCTASKYRFLLGMVFDRWSTHMSIHVHRKAFRAIRLLACFRWLSVSRNIELSDVNCGLFMRLHFSIGCHDYRRTTRLRQSVLFSRIQVLFADHVHRRSGVDNKFSFLRFNIWCRQAPIFRRWEECFFVFSF